VIAMKIGSRTRTALVPIAALLVSLVPACGGALRTTSLRVSGGVPDASVTIDDQYVGALAFVASRGVALPPGKHRVTVEKAGYFPWDHIVEAHEGDAPIRLDVPLTKIPD
jgi:hypothetical protein